MIQHEIGDSGSATWDPLRRPNRIHLNEESLLSRPGGSVQVFREGDYTLHAEMKGAMTQRVNRVLIEADAGDAGSKVAPLADISGVDERGNRIKLTGGYLRDSNSTHVTAPAVGEYSVGADFQCIEIESGFGVSHSEAARWRCVVWTLNCPIRRGDLGRVPFETSNEGRISRLTNGFGDGLQEKGCRDAYWFARLTSTSPVPIGPTLIGSGLEGLINAWLASPEGRSSGTRLNRADWQLIRDSIEPILLDKLKPYGDPRRFIEGFQNLNRLAVSEQAERFFGEIGLAIGEVERHAMKIRNPLAHGALFRRGFVHELYMATSAYRTLFNRTVLMLLRWNESYIDYSTYKYPSRSLGSPLGGPNGDGRPVLIPRG